VINFRYHIVSLAAVFIALAIGVVLGASVLGQGLNSQILAQAQTDRQALADLRAESLQQQALSRYRDAYAEQLGTQLTRAVLAGQTVAVVALPKAPAGVVDDVAAVVDNAGGTVSNTVTITEKAYDPKSADELGAVLDQFGGSVSVAADDPVSTRLGATLARATVSREPLVNDDVATSVLSTLQQERYISAARTKAPRATLLVVVGAVADPKQAVSSDVLDEHVQTVLALHEPTLATVVAGPNSTGVAATDVAAIRSTPAAARAMSSVDVADLPSGLTTVLLCLVEEQQGRNGHYGAASSADAPAPRLTR
jgi:hypothetical protein